MFPGPGWYNTSPMVSQSKIAGGAFGNSTRPFIGQKGSEFEPGPNDYRPIIAAIRPHRPAPKIPGVFLELDKSKNKGKSSTLSQDITLKNMKLPA